MPCRAFWDQSQWSTRQFLQEESTQTCFTRKGDRTQILKNQLCKYGIHQIFTVGKTEVGCHQAIRYVADSFKYLASFNLDPNYWDMIQSVFLFLRFNLWGFFSLCVWARACLCVVVFSLSHLDYFRGLDGRIITKILRTKLSRKTTLSWERQLESERISVRHACPRSL